jgi:hypothetical protein
MLGVDAEGVVSAGVMILTWYVVWYSIRRRWRAEELILTPIIEELSITNYVSDLRGELNLGVHQWEFRG